jgi:hypothetical protein
MKGVKVLANRDVRLALFEDTNFSGRRILLTRGGIVIRDARAFDFNGALSSFRLRNVVDSNEITLVLFSRTNFRGARRVFRGNTTVSDLGDYDNRMSSLILVGRRLTDAQINTIRDTGRPPRDVLQVRQ